MGGYKMSSVPLPPAWRVDQLEAERVFPVELTAPMRDRDVWEPLQRRRCVTFRASQQCDMHRVK